MINWETALAYCRGQSLAGYTDWRLPSIEELHSLAIYANNPLIDGSVFYLPNTAGGLSGLPQPRRMIIILPILGASMGKK
jgi:hypothetical protein